MTPDWQSDCGRVKLYCADSLTVRPTLGKVDACITDPPYGMGNDADTTRFSGGQRRPGDGIVREQIVGDDKPFDPTPWLAFDAVVLWGCNHYGQRLPVGSTLVWIKKHDHMFGTFLSDCELAWERGGCGVYAFKRHWLGGKTQHPNEKPESLLLWCVQRNATTGQTILDPFMGSGTTGVAALRHGCSFIGVEIEPRYFAIAKRRIMAELAQGNLFQPAPEPPKEQRSLL